MLIVLAIVSVLEPLIWLPFIWRHVRKLFACIIILGVAVVSGLLIGHHWSWWNALIVIISMYRMVNLLRLVEGRSIIQFMKRSTFRTSMILIVFQVVVVLLEWGINHVHMIVSEWLYILGLIDIVIAALILLAIRLHIRTTQPSLSTKHYADRDLPDVTVAIPARNETDDLRACLESLVRSDYPKLEIIVLDDCSQNKHTPEIIKDFAHAGVVFIDGKAPPEHWLAKNYAYEQLALEANGELILFCGVDVRFDTHSVKDIVEVMLSKKLSMMSVMPENNIPTVFSFRAFLYQPVRYAWQLIPPRNFLKRPPVLSSCWIINKDQLNRYGSFKAITNTIGVEGYFARTLLAEHNSYAFVRAQHTYGISSHKQYSDQRDTAIRTRYPQTHRRPEVVCGLSLSEIVILLFPLYLLIWSLISGHLTGFFLAVINIVLLSLGYASIVRTTYNRFLIISLISYPFAALYDIAILQYSMWQYEFREVIWKGRNVCIPLMRYESSVPPK
jgi:glycosyltransferase involved in cell wall biosynthesis